MDTHHAAHYGIAGALTAAMAFGYAMMPAAEPSYPTLGAATAKAVIVAANDSVKATKGDKPLWVLCAGKACLKISHELMRAGKSAKINIQSDVLLGGASNVSVGAPTQKEADALKVAVESASHGKLHVSEAFAPHALYYVSFGYLDAE